MLVNYEDSAGSLGVGGSILLHIQNYKGLTQ